MNYIGIDPGKMGGFAIIYGDGKFVCHPWDNETFIEELTLINDERCVACVERVGAMRGQGVTSMFSFGKSAGFIEGVLTALKIPYQLIMPRTWKAEFGLNSDKAKSIEVCKRLFPNARLLRTDKCRTEHDGMAESLLMAEYARRKL